MVRLLLILSFAMITNLFSNVYMVDIFNNTEGRSFLYKEYNNQNIKTIDKLNGNSQYFYLVQNRKNNYYNNTGLYRLGNDGSVYLYNNPTSDTLNIINNDGWNQVSYSEVVSLNNMNEVYNYPIIFAGSDGLNNNSLYRSLTFYNSNEDNWGWYKDTTVKYTTSQNCTNASWRPNYIGECTPECPINMYDELVSSDGSCKYEIEWEDGIHYLELPKYTYKEFYGLYDSLDSYDETTSDMIQDYYDLSPLEFFSKYDDVQVTNIINNHIPVQNRIMNYDYSSQIPVFDLVELMKIKFSDLSSFVTDDDGNVIDVVHHKDIEMYLADFDEEVSYNEAVCDIARDVAKFHKLKNYAYNSYNPQFVDVPLYKTCYDSEYNSIDIENFDFNIDNLEITDEQRANALQIDLNNLDSLNNVDFKDFQSSSDLSNTSKNDTLTESQNTLIENTSNSLSTASNTNNNLSSVNNSNSNYENFTGNESTTTTVTTSSGDTITITNDNTSTVNAINHLGSQIIDSTNVQTQNLTNQIQNQTQNLNNAIQNQTENLTNQIQNQTQNFNNSIQNQTDNLTNQIQNQTQNLTSSIQNQTQNLTGQIQGQTQSITNEIKTSTKKTTDKLDDLIRAIQANSSFDSAPIVNAINSASNNIVTELSSIKSDTAQIANNTMNTNTKLDDLINAVNSKEFDSSNMENSLNSIDSKMDNLVQFTEDIKTMGSDDNSIETGFEEALTFYENISNSTTSIFNNFNNVKDILDNGFSNTNLSQTYNINCLSTSLFGKTVTFDFITPLSILKPFFALFFQIVFLAFTIKILIKGVSLVTFK